MPPARIGRYRIVRSLGSGGMGEVLEGFDDQLRRPVAIKGLHAERSGPERRERLRREALAVAALSHPAVAHVYEIVTEDDRDWVVMEFVEGRSLADLVTAGPLPAAEVARIGEQVARALAAAHHIGIIHRDVKAENVMVTPAGDVKVLDFGLARWTGARAPSSDRLTTEGMVVGTARAMSPEQATGLECDHRTDIFSLGSLLYELAVGRSPFSAATPVETMYRVARVSFEPLSQVAPQLPEPLTVVIEGCLQKDPDDRLPTAQAVADRLRPLTFSATGVMSARTTASHRLAVPWVRRHAWGVAAAAALAAAALLALWGGWLRPPRALAIAVLPVEVGGDAGSELASAAVADAIAARLSRIERVEVVSGREVRAVAGADKRATEVARELGVVELIEASLTQETGEAPARITLARIDGPSGKVIWSEELETATDDVLLLQDRITSALADAYEGYSTTAAPPREATPEAVRIYLEADARLQTGTPSRGYAEEIAAFERARAQSPRYLDPIVRLAGIQRYLFQTTHREEHLERCRELVAAAERLSPTNPRVLAAGIELALAADDGARALELAGRYTALRPGEAGAWLARGRALSALGRVPEAERALEHAAALRPYWFPYWTLGRLREDHGDYAGARAAIRTLFTHSPGNLHGVSLLAEVEMYAGNHVEAERLYRDLAARRDTRLDLIHLGNCLFYQKRYSEAADLYRQAATRDDSDALALANLGDALDALQDRAGAERCWSDALAIVEEQVADGNRHREALETRARCLAHLGRGADAVVAAEEALAAFPSNPATLFTAALVHALNGEESACLVWTRRALAANAPQVWFAGPEFTRVRANPQLGALLAGR